MARFGDCVLARLEPPTATWLLCGRYELRRGEWDPAVLADQADLPATGLSFLEFEAWAAARGLRAPTLAEWRFLAGTPEFASDRSPISRNTLEFELGRALPVGVFERARSPWGAYDFYGNAREFAGPPLDGRVATVGGSYAMHRVDERELTLVEVNDRAEDLGARYVADAIPFVLERIVPLWRADRAGVGAAVRAAAARWRADLRTGFGQALRAAGAPPEFAALFLS